LAARAKCRLRSIGILLAILFIACHNWKSFKNIQQKDFDLQRPQQAASGEPRFQGDGTGFKTAVEVTTNHIINNKDPATKVDSKKSRDNTRSSHKKNKPNLIVHIGPAKTGTSTLQKNSRDFTNVLAMDGYIYAGKFGIQQQREAIQDIFDVNDCLFVTEAYLQNHSLNNTNGRLGTEGVLKAKDNSCWKTRVTKMDKYLENNTSIIISDEVYSINSKRQSRSKREYEALRAVFQDWDLSFVVTYRRYAEWMLSALKQKHSWQCVGEKIDWKGQCQTPINFIKNNWKKHNSTSTNMYRNIDETSPVIQSANIPVKILNFHEEQHITSSFYCDIIPNTPHTCQHTIGNNRSGKGVAENARVIVSSSCSTIVYDAVKIGLSGIDKAKQTRHETTLNCVEFMNTHNITHADLPLHCPRQDLLERLLKKSLAFEEKILPDFFVSEMGEVEHRRLFWSMVDERKEFCHVNTKELLKGKTSWEEALTSLKKGNTESPL